jgi:AraC-like DNA-binding protein
MRADAASLSGIASHFKQKAGQMVLDYLIHWRMHKATRLIRRGNLSLTQIAESVGCLGKAAFNRMFKREMDVTPGRFRTSTAAAV